LELDGVSTVLYAQLSESVQQRVAQELTRCIFDAVRGPVTKSESIRMEYIGETTEEVYKDRTIVEGTIRGIKTVEDRRLTIRLLASYVRGPTSSAFGEALSQFPSLVMSPDGRVSVRRLYLNDVDINLAQDALRAVVGEEPPRGHTGSPNSVAAFEARHRRGITTPIVTHVGHPVGVQVSRDVSPHRYPDRNIYATPATNRALDVSSASALYAPPAQEGGLLKQLPTEVSAYHSPSSSYGVTRYRTRKYENY
jgi:hypothetical protein